MAAMQRFYIENYRVLGVKLLVLALGAALCFPTVSAKAQDKPNSKPKLKPNPQLSPEPNTDWPQFQGPKRNLRGESKGLLRQFPPGGPKVLWKQAVGEGYAGPVIADGKLIIFHRLGAKETVQSLDAKSGKPIWKFDYVAEYRDGMGKGNGPRATPTIAGGYVYTHGVTGILYCLDFKTGKEIWKVDTQGQFGSRPGFFGRACSPLVVGDTVMLNVGGKSVGIAGFDRKTGKTRWKATSDEAGYASPTAARIPAKGGKTYALFHTRDNLVVIEPATGKVLLSKRFRAQMHASVNAATPLVIDDLVFLSSSYGAGAVVLRLELGDGQAGKATELWSGDDILSNHYATSVHDNGFVYGFDGRQESGQRLRCIALKTGKIQWTKDNITPGTLMIADRKLLILNEEGELIIAPVSRRSFTVSARAKILDGRTRAYPALAGGLYYARDGQQLICLDLRDQK